MKSKRWWGSEGSAGEKPAVLLDGMGQMPALRFLSMASYRLQVIEKLSFFAVEGCVSCPG
jgi:hypothetical protein